MKFPNQKHLEIKRRNQRNKNSFYKKYQKKFRKDRFLESRYGKTKFEFFYVSEFRGKLIFKSFAGFLRLRQMQQIWNLCIILLIFNTPVTSRSFASTKICGKVVLLKHLKQFFAYRTDFCMADSLLNSGRIFFSSNFRRIHFLGTSIATTCSQLKCNVLHPAGAYRHALRTIFTK